MNESENKRLFIAIDLPETIKQAIGELQITLKRYARDAKWVRSEGMHLTLKFLGYVGAGRIDEIARALDSAATNYAPFLIELAGCGFFPNARRPNVLWAGIRSEGIFPLQQEIETGMEGLGFPKENRRFSPHLTLCRFRESAGLLPLAREIEKLKEKTFGDFHAREYALFESVLKRSGAEYSKLRIFQLTQ